MKNSILLLTVSLLPFANLLRGNPYYVSPDGGHVYPYTTWADAATNIQDAVTAAGTSGATVWVSNGFYQVSAQITVNNVQVRSWPDGKTNRDATIVDGNYPAQTNRCFLLNHADALVEGFTIQNGAVSGNLSGGGVNITAGTLRHSRVMNNIAKGITSGAHGGGGVFLTGVNSLVDDCDITDNLVHAGSIGQGGGGVKIASGARLRNSRILYNNSPIYWTGGGGVHATGNALVKNCLIAYNKVGVDYNLGASRSTALYAWGGGGVWAEGGNAVTLRNCVILGNGLGSQPTGTGVGAHGGGATIENCTIIDNIGAGIGAVNASTFNVANTISYYNTGGDMNAGNNGTLNADYTIAGSLANVTSGDNNTTDVPSFVDRATGRLWPWSVGVDQGTNLAWMATATDIEGNPRISANGLPDIGSYETAMTPAPFHYADSQAQTPIPPFTNGWASASSNLNEVIAAAFEGATVLIAPGDYVLTNQLVVGNLSVRSDLNGVVDPDNTFVIGGNQPGDPAPHRIFLLNSRAAWVEGLTITNGYSLGVDLNDAAAHGGGARITAGTLKNCTVIGNTATNAGGGGIFASGAHSRVTDCRVIHNISNFPDSGRVGHAGGGGLLMENGAQLRNSLIQANECPIYASAGGGLNLRNNTLVENSIIIDNTSADGWAAGGIWFHRGGNRLRNCLIVGNNDGRSTFGAGVSGYQNYANQIENCTIVANLGHGIGARTSNGTTYHILNTIVYGNTIAPVYAGPNGTIIATNCLFEVTNNVTVSSGVITNSPIFVNEALRNFRLRPDSPGVNAGLNLEWMADATDLDGNPRIDRLSQQVDMGAYEFIYRGTLLMVK